MFDMNHFKLYASLLLALILCSFAATLGQAKAHSDAPKWKLEIESPRETGKTPAKLKNVGSQAQWAFQIGDGSTVGWREPRVYWEVQAKVDSVWTDLEIRPIARCGLYDSDWQKDAVKVAPGESLDLATEWTGRAHYSYDMKSQKQYRGRLRYHFTGGKARKGSPMMSPVKLDYGPGYVVVSNWVELQPEE